MAKKLHVVSLGCPKNRVDLELMLASLSAAGYELTAEPEAADLLLVNTCGFIKSAADEAIDVILELAELKKVDPEKKLVAAGCLVQRYGGDLAAELPEVDLFVGLDDFPDIARLLGELEAGRQRCVTRPGPARYLMDSRAPRVLATPFFRADLKITEGCDNRCAYCMIPSIRGPLRSRPMDDLIIEAKRLEAGGLKELTLIAQDLTAYGRDLGMAEGLHRLLEALLARTAIPWIRLMYLYPTGVGDDLLSLMAGEPRVLPYLDVPMQHVNDRVLAAMGRRYRRRDLEQFLERVRTHLLGCALRSTFMVGFPGETEDEARELVEAISSWGLDHVGVFAYEDEEGAPSHALPDKVTKAVKKKRLDAAMKAQAAVSASLLATRVGTTLPVLVEGYSEESDLLLEGRAAFQAADIDGRVYINAGRAERGEIVNVRVTEAHVYDLVGEIAES